MAKRVSLLFLSLFFVLICISAKKSKASDIGMQLLKNAHGGVSVNKVNKHTSYAGYVGTGYKYYFYKNSAYLYPQIDLQCGQYKHDTSNDSYTETTSLAIPVVLGYDLVSSNVIGVNLYVGGRYEQILHTSHNTYSAGVNNSQAGLLGGATIRIANKFGVTLSYYYGLTNFYRDGTGKVSSFNFAFNF